jgi:hypothetical protein
LTLADDLVTLTEAILSGKEFLNIDTMPVIAAYSFYIFRLFVIQV